MDMVGTFDRHVLGRYVGTSYVGENIVFLPHTLLRGKMMWWVASNYWRYDTVVWDLTHFNFLYQREVQLLDTLYKGLLALRMLVFLGWEVCELCTSK